MFNPHPKVDALPLFDDHVCWVVDDALDDPARWVDYAVAQRQGFALAPHNAYPGLEFALPEPLAARLADFFGLHLRRRLGGRRTLQMHGRLALVTLPPEQLSPIQWLCHRDRLGVPSDQCVAASVLSLFQDEALGGTSFFRPLKSADETERLMRAAAGAQASPAAFAAEYAVAPGYLVQSNPWFEQVCTVPPRWNRMIFYDGNLFHSPDIRQPQRLGPEPDSGRLTLNGFFTCSRTRLA